MEQPHSLLDELAAWVSASPEPAVCYAALHRTRSFNRPAALAGLLFQAAGDYGEWQFAGTPCRLPLNHLSVSCCHQGGYSPVPKQPVELWAVAFDLAGMSAFDYLWTAPAREVTAVGNPARLIAAYQRVADRFVNDGTHGDPLFLKAAVLELLAVARCEFRHAALGTSLRPEAVTQAIDWMNGHFHDSGITLADVVQASGLSQHHFGRLFREAMGESVMEYLRRLRIRHSCGLLQGTALRIKEVARAVGFNDPLHFSRVFHEETGKSPRAFRSGAEPIVRTPQIASH